MFNDIIQKKKKWITIYAPYIPLQVTKIKKDDMLGEGIRMNIDKIILKKIKEDAKK